MAYIKSTATVYAGPWDGGSYPVRNTLSAGDSVIIMFQHGVYYYVSYLTSSGQRKCGYVGMDFVDDFPEHPEAITEEPKQMYLERAGLVYYGPSTDYLYIDYLEFGTAVTFLGIRDTGYALIEFAHPDTNMYEVGYFLEDALCEDLMQKYRTFKRRERDAAGKIIRETVSIPAEYPMGGATVTQGFNDTETYGKGHLGYDLFNGDLSVCALFDGVVAKVEPSIADANGRVICLHHNIRGIEFYTAYCHLAPPTNELPFLSEGDVVTAGQRIATMGGSGNGLETTYNTHLHVCAFTASAPNTAPQGYANRGLGQETMEAVSNGNYQEARRCYGPDTTKFPSCWGLCFYDPYGVVSTAAEVIRLYPEKYEESIANGDTPNDDTSNEEAPVYHRCDVNMDGVVDELDLTRAQRYFGTDNPNCDVDGSGEVDMTDLIMILNNFTE